MSILSIVIPTYNRSNKLFRLLKNIEDEVTDLNFSIRVYVSDNASNDDTEIVVKNFKTNAFNLEYYRQEKNIGFDGNVRFLYDKAKSEYVWFFSDDDILLPRSIETVINGLLTTNPDVLLYSFNQPKESTSRTFNFLSEFELIRDPKQIIKLVGCYPKLSIYVCRKVLLSDKSQHDLIQFHENGFFWIDLCYSILLESDNNILCVISKPLASCDDDFINIRFDPNVFLYFHNVYKHPYVVQYLPKMSEEFRACSYYNTIQLLFAVKVGALKADDPDLYDREIKNFVFLPLLLLRNPKAMFQLLLIKYKFYILYAVYKQLRLSIINLRL
jgi:glycosyltransferase involved in cell wall biosynthesis